MFAKKTHYSLQFAQDTVQRQRVVPVLAREDKDNTADGASDS